ncbi:hypothetical protein AGIG_G19487 [Arapaima gigas]
MSKLEQILILDPANDLKFKAAVAAILRNRAREGVRAAVEPRARVSRSPPRRTLPWPCRVVLRPVSGPNGRKLGVAAGRVSGVPAANAS